MQEIQIRILALDELPPWPEINKAEAPPSDKVAILQRGTAGGRTSVRLGGTLADGKVVFLQLSANAFLTIMGGVKGAVARFGDKFND